MALSNLVLTRRLGEQISINDGEITVTVVALKKSQVKISIRADEKIRINRTELAENRGNK